MGGNSASIILHGNICGVAAFFKRNVNVSAFGGVGNRVREKVQDYAFDFLTVGIGEKLVVAALKFNLYALFRAHKGNGGNNVGTKLREFNS